MLSKCSGSHMTVSDVGAQNCESVQGASKDINAITGIISEVSLKNSF